MAKRFEKPEDIERENKACALLIGDSGRFTSKKLGPHEVDFLIYDTQSETPTIPFAALEVKGVKKVPSVHTPHTPIVAIKKLASLQKYINEKHITNTIIAWAYADGIKFAKVTELKGKVQWGGQFKPRAGSVNDHELMFVDTNTSFKIKTY